MIKQHPVFKRVYKKLPGVLSSAAASLYSRRMAKRKYGRTYHSWRAFLEESQFYSATECRDWQKETLSKFLLSIQRTSSYFTRDEYQALPASKRNDPHSLIRSFPIMDKAIVRAAADGIRSVEDRDTQLRFLTSGTTGTSLAVYQDQAAYQREYAFRWKYLSVAGAERGDRFAFFIGNNLYETDRRKPPYHIQDSAESGLYFSIFHIAAWSIKDYVEAFNRFRPSYVKGYPSALFDYCKLASDAGLESVPQKAVFTASEVLHQYQRDVIEDYFQAEIYQWYGQVETTVNIHECVNHRLHVKEEYGLLELLDDDDEPVAPGEAGHAVGTSWGNHAFPLVRYRSGDNMVLAADQQCDCGMNGRIIDRIVGRDEDVIVTPDGRRLGRLDFIFKPVTTVKESQIIQTAIDAVLVRVVPEGQYGSSDERALRNILTDYLGSGMKISFEQVDMIPRSANGKIRYVISDLP